MILKRDYERESRNHLNPHYVHYIIERPEYVKERMLNFLCSVTNVQDRDRYQYIIGLCNQVLEGGHE